MASQRSLQHRVDNFLFSHRSAPHTFTERTPAKLFPGRKLRLRLSLLKPDTKAAIKEKALKTKCSMDIYAGAQPAVLLLVTEFWCIYCYRGKCKVVHRNYNISEIHRNVSCARERSNSLCAHRQLAQIILGSVLPRSRRDRRN